MDLFDIEPQNGIKFNYRGASVDAELRPLWRISLLALILYKLCSGNKANLKKIQVLYALVSSDKKRAAYRRGLFSSENINIRFDPLVDRAIDIGIGEKLFAIDDAKSIKLTPKGVKFAKKIDVDTNLFILESDFINAYSKSHFNDQRINNIIQGNVIC
ncbi:hypothetical protein CRG86_007040 [Photobacterium leiognathi]|nr:hypothetical protein CRG86_007040 [Photobacterium leiognathi]